MADSVKDTSVELAEREAEDEAVPGAPEPEEAAAPAEEAVRESDPARVAQAVASTAPEVRAEEFSPYVEGDTTQPWAVGTSNATTLTHSSLELAPNLTEAQKATRRKLN